MQQLPTSIRITAVPSYGYPFPAQSVPQFNIGSDTDAWRGEHAWTNTTSEDYPAWYKKLNQLKLCLFKANIRSDQIETTSNSIEESIDSSDASPNPLEVISQTETDMNDQESN
jgi:hypothetical protein